MSFFNIINNTLENESINDLAKIPTQFYHKNYSEFIENFTQFLSSKKHNNSIFLLWDGTFKKESPNSKQDATQKLLSLLKDTYTVSLIDLSKTLNIKTEDLHASEMALNALRNEIKNFSSETIFITCGSGTLTDLLKHALYLDKKDSIYISIPTALTVTAFTSSFSIVDFSGAKRTRESKNISATFWLEPMLQAAPLELTRAGYGDLLARFVAYGDWFLGYKLGIFERYDELAYRLMEPFADKLKQIAPQIGDENIPSQAIEVLSAAISMAGIAMSVSGETTPLSGYEHVISHALDFLHLTSNSSLVLHGEQVALASLTSAMSYDWLLEQKHFDLNNARFLNDKEVEKQIKSLLLKAPIFEKSIVPKINFDIDKVYSIFSNDYILKNQKWIQSKDKFQIFIDNWEETRNHLKKITIPSSEMLSLLEKSKLPTSPEETNPKTSALEYRWAIRFSPFVRARFSIADFIYWIGEDTCSVAAI